MPRALLRKALPILGHATRRRKVIGYGVGPLPKEQDTQEDHRDSPEVVKKKKILAGNQTSSEQRAESCSISRAFPPQEAATVTTPHYILECVYSIYIYIYK
jgi:hypothetical protein